ncbi:MAG TPA: type II toxin-antitoxin system RelE/ParE family toxin [Terriglobia bacterium]|nr:type II toxin-antitoxin system RelE/ParE family toxin [Terriglobia bacterium]
MTWTVEFYEDETGNRPVEAFLERLSDGQVGKILQVFEMLEEWGPRLPFPYSSQVEGRLRELRVHYGRSLYRVFYYADARRTFVLLHAFEKRSQAIPDSEVRVAIARMAKDRERKGGKL